MRWRELLITMELRCYPSDSGGFRPGCLGYKSPPVTFSKLVCLFLSRFPRTTTPLLLSLLYSQWLGAGVSQSCLPPYFFSLILRTLHVYAPRLPTKYTSNHHHYTLSHEMQISNRTNTDRFLRTIR